MPINAPKLSHYFGGGTQVRSGRVDSVPILQGHRRGGSHREVTDAICWMAIYLDKPKQNLVRNKIILQRHAGGPDPGWHLELPARTDVRTEICARPWSRPAIRCQPSCWM